MSDAPVLLGTHDMARFVARGFLRFDAVVPEETNRAFLGQATKGEVPGVRAGTPLDEAYPLESALHDVVRVPRVRGAIESLVGKGSLLDHHFLHQAFPPEVFKKLGATQVSQHTHQDSTIDVRMAFDIQLLYFPHEVTEVDGGTRFVPGTHLRRVSEAAVARYQNIRGQQHVVCPAGSVFVFHHGMWHGGGLNRGDAIRTMFKIRLQPTVRQSRLWDTSDLDPAELEPRPIFWQPEKPGDDELQSILCAAEPWFENDTGRLEFIQRIRLWRYVLGDDEFDADYWVTRIENDPGRAAPA